MATQPVLGGVTLPHPSAYSTEQILQGGVLEMADGGIVIDVVSPGLIGSYRTIHKLEWSMLSYANAETVTGAYWSMVDDGEAEFTSPEGNDETVTATKNVNVNRSVAKIAGGTLRYNVSFELKRIL